MNLNESFKNLAAKDMKTEVATNDLELFQSMLNVLPNPDPILRKMGRGIDVYRDLTGDWEVFAAIELIHGGLSEQDWRITPGNADTDTVDYLQQFIKEYWDVHQILGQCIEARLYGYQPFEFLWSKVDGRWMITGIEAKPQEWFHYDSDNMLRIRTKENRIQGELAHPHKFFCVRNRPSYRNPYGESVLSRTFWPVAFKKGGIRWWAKFLEKYGMPWIVGKQPRGEWGPKEKVTQDLLTMLDQMVQDAVAVIPDDSSVEIMEPGGRGSSSDAFQRKVTYCDAVINKVILSSETAMSVSKGGGDVRGDSAEHARVSRSVIRSAANGGESLMNHAIKLMMHYNFGGDPPELTVYEPKSVQQGLAERDKTLTETGVSFKKEYFERAYGLSAEDFQLAPSAPKPPQIPMFSHHRGCSCSGCQKLDKNVATFQQVPDELSTEDAQKVVDEMIETAGGTPSDEANQKILKELLAPVMKTIREAGSYEEAMKALVEIYPEMDTDKLEERLRSAMFLADTWGRLNVEEENEE